MPVNKDIEEVFLGVLREGGGKEKINKRICYFQDNDWQALFDFSIKNGLFPIFYHRLLSLKLENIPYEFLSQLKNLYLLNLKRNIVLEKELLEVLGYLKKNNIPAIPLKGTILARFLYNDISLRQVSGDLDILVKPEDIEEAERKLEVIGYTFNSNQDRANFYHSYNTEIPLGRHLEGSHSVALDLHWNIRYRFINTHLKDFWENAREISIDGHPVLMPSCDDALLYLVLISMCDIKFVQIKYLYDLHALTSIFFEEIDWKELVKKAKSLKLDTLLYFALKLSQNLFNTDIPKNVLNTVKPLIIKENLLKIWINKTNILKKRDKISSSFTWNYFVSSLFYSSSIRDSIKISYRKIFKPIEEVMGQNNQPLSKVSYFLYIKRLLKPFIKFFKREVVSPFLLALLFIYCQGIF